MRAGKAWRALAQPTARSHPHVLNDGELTAGITAAEYAARRQAALALLQPNEAAVFIDDRQ